MVNAQFLGMLAVLLGNSRGDHDDGQIAQAHVPADVARQIKAVHARHLNVRQHHCGPLFLKPLKRLQTIGRHGHAITLALQQALGDAPHGDGVINHQNQRNLWRHRCRRSQPKTRSTGTAGS